MKQNIKDFISAWAIIFPIIYVLGFVIVNSYLSNYGVSDYDIISLNYLKSGILYIIICLAFTFAAEKKNSTKNENISDVWTETTALCHELLIICSIISPFIFGIYQENFYKKISILEIFSSTSLLIYLIVRVYFSRKKISEKKYIIICNIFLSILLLIFLLPSIIQNHYVIIFIIFFSTISILLSAILKDIKDNRIEIKELSYAIIIIIIYSVLYGKFLYGEVPTYLGGPITTPKEIYLNDSIMINDSTVKMLSEKQIVYSNSYTYFVKFNDTTLIAIDRAMVKYSTYNFGTYQIYRSTKILKP